MAKALLLKVRCRGNDHMVTEKHVDRTKPLQHAKVDYLIDTQLAGIWPRVQPDILSFSSNEERAGQTICSKKLV